jgi:hypothetical protein
VRVAAPARPGRACPGRGGRGDRRGQGSAGLHQPARSGRRLAPEQRASSLTRRSAGSPAAPCVLAGPEPLGSRHQIRRCLSGVRYCPDRSASWRDRWSSVRTRSPGAGSRFARTAPRLAPRDLLVRSEWPRRPLLDTPGVDVLTPPSRVRRLLRTNAQPRSAPMKEAPGMTEDPLPDARHGGRHYRRGNQRGWPPWEWLRKSGASSRLSTRCSMPRNWAVWGECSTRSPTVLRSLIWGVPPIPVHDDVADPVPPSDQQGCVRAQIEPGERLVDLLWRARRSQLQVVRPRVQEPVGQEVGQVGGQHAHEGPSGRSLGHVPQHEALTGDRDSWRGCTSRQEIVAPPVNRPRPASAVKAAGTPRIAQEPPVRTCPHCPERSRVL